ncbi:uncharacterized protein HaLaN_28444 [Haematococcus lacustris]|uniref:Glutathione S-transferase C-terminal domain-containing protein n=1 Tax=Haematococcus lacustris TaxID=44745 RepID=A0A6A0AAT8_HAELA|nr:uncharacterized protein HaLaN_28444 [Haematococcus lacustris]
MLEQEQAGSHSRCRLSRELQHCQDSQCGCGGHLADGKVQTCLCSTFSIKDADKKAVAHKAVAEGPLQTKIAKLNALLTEAGQDGYLVGGRMTYADVAAFVVMSFLGSGLFDGKVVPMQPSEPCTPGMLSWSCPLCQAASRQGSPSKLTSLASLTGLPKLVCPHSLQVPPGGTPAWSTATWPQP